MGTYIVVYDGGARLRSGFPIESTLIQEIPKGQVVHVLERRSMSWTGNGTIVRMRVRYGPLEGWISERLRWATGIGEYVVRPYDGTANNSDDDNDDVCPNGHPLKAFKAPNMSFRCNLCKEYVRYVGEGMQSCRNCNWDICQRCSRPGALALQKHTNDDDNVDETMMRLAEQASQSPGAFLVGVAAAGLVAYASSTTSTTARTRQQSLSYHKYTNDFELVIRATKDLEDMLTKKFGAPTSWSLMQKIEWLHNRFDISDHAMSTLKKLVQTRNNLVHNVDYNSLGPGGRNEFAESYDSVAKELFNALGEDPYGERTGEGCTVM